jgi:hypothetical protein
MQKQGDWTQRTSWQDPNKTEIVADSNERERVGGTDV